MKSILILCLATAAMADYSGGGGGYSGGGGFSGGPGGILSGLFGGGVQVSRPVAAPQVAEFSQSYVQGGGGGYSGGGGQFGGGGGGGFAAPVQVYQVPVTQPVYAAPQQVYSGPEVTYSAPTVTYSAPSVSYSAPSSGGFSSGGNGGGGGGGGGYASGPSNGCGPGGCGSGPSLGGCGGGGCGSGSGPSIGGGNGAGVAPTSVHKHVYVHVAPDEAQDPGIPIRQETTKSVHYKIIFVKAPTYKVQQPITQRSHLNEEKTIVYVLSKKPEIADPIILNSPQSGPTQPEVYFIKYKAQKGGSGGPGGAGDPGVGGPSVGGPSGGGGGGGSGGYAKKKK